MEDLGSICPYVQILDLPVPQMEDPFVDNLNLVDATDAVRRLLDRPISEQVIEVPKFIIDDIPTRTLVPEPRWRNSWWKYRRPCLTLRYSGLWSSTSTFQFLVVEDHVLVFKVLSQDSVLQRRLPENAFLSGLWNRSLTLFLVEVFLVLSQVRVHLLLTLQLVLKNALMSLVKGFFTLFPKIKKKCEGCSALWVGTASAPQLMDGSGSAGGFRRVGAAQG